MAEKLVIKGPVFIEDEGRPVAVLVPIELFRAWQQQLQTQAPHSHPPQPAESLSGFEREKAAFERMKPVACSSSPRGTVCLKRRPL